MPNTAEPSDFAGTSKRGGAVPMMRYSAKRFRSATVTAGICAGTVANPATSP